MVFIITSNNDRHIIDTFDYNKEMHRDDCHKINLRIIVVKNNMF